MRLRSLLAIPTAVALAATLLLAGAAGGAAGRAGFSARVDNPWFPLKPGTTYVYAGIKDGKAARDVVTVTHRTTTIEGAPCVVVADRLYLDGKLAERTTDWYTQDSHGNVWYFGEDTAVVDKAGRVISTEGSWQAGVGGAKPGIFMPAVTRVGRSFRQELYPGHAEDHFRIVGLIRPLGTGRGSAILVTREWTPLEPGIVDRKLYVRGVGTVVERAVKGGDEHLELVSLRAGG